MQKDGPDQHLSVYKQRGLHSGFVGVKVMGHHGGSL